MGDFARTFGEALERIPDDAYDSSPMVPGVGPLDADVMLVGEAPGETEVERGTPFVGRAGRRLTEVLERVGVDRSDVYITNVVKVRPPDNRTPHVPEIEQWRPVLDAELNHVEPSVVVPLGATATDVLVEGSTKISSVHGQRFEQGGRVVVPTFHPAATLYDPNKVDALEADLRIAVEIP